MTITDRYISTLLPSLASAVTGGAVTPTTFTHGNGWKFPCPFCCEKVSKSYKKKTQCAALMPNGNYSYVFQCRRKKSVECFNNMLFPYFLKSYNPKLFAQYHRDREEAGSTGKGHDLGKYNYFGDNK